MEIKKSLSAELAACILALSVGSAQAGVVIGFEGTSQYDNVALAAANNFIPPDTMGAVGTTQFVQSSNGSYAVFDKAAGGVLQRITMEQFWSNADQAAQANGDQRVLFDNFTNRWITIGFGASLSDINIAVSDTANAMGAWKSTKFTGFAGGVADYPTLGMDQKGVYIGTNNFNLADAFQGTSLFVIPKADLFGGAPTTVNLTKFDNVYPSTTDLGFSIQGAVNRETKAVSDNTASVMAVNTDLYNQNFYRLNGVDAAGATKGATSLIGGIGYTFDFAHGARQPDGSRVVDTLDDRISSNVVQHAGMLYSVHTVTPTGTNHTAIRWSVVNATTGALISEGDISGGDYDYFQGSIAVNEWGQVVIGYNRSGFQTADLNGDGLADGNISFMARSYNSFGTGFLIQTDEYLLKVSTISDYHNGSIETAPPAGPQRWGDYSAVTIDPTNEQSFWAIGEFAREWNNAAGGHPDGTGGSRWGTWIANIQVADIGGAVPEPETFSLMLAGLLAAGAMARWRRKSATGRIR